MVLDYGGKNKRITITPQQEPRYCSLLFYLTTYTPPYYLIGAVYSTFLLLHFATTRVYQQYRYHAKVILLNEQFCVTVNCLLFACLFEGYITSYALRKDPKSLVAFGNNDLSTFIKRKEIKSSLALFVHACPPCPFQT